MSDAPPIPDKPAVVQFRADMYQLRAEFCREMHERIREAIELTLNPDAPMKEREMARKMIPQLADAFASAGKVTRAEYRTHVKSDELRDLEREASKRESSAQAEGVSRIDALRAKASARAREQDADAPPATAAGCEQDA